MCLFIVDGTGVNKYGLFNAFFFVPWINPGEYVFPPHFIGWTLSYEFSFYLLVALVAILGFSRYIAWLGVAMVVFVVAGTVFSPSVFLLEWFSNPFFLEFALGLGIWALWRRWADAKWFRTAGLAAGAIGVAIVLVEIVVGYGNVSDTGGTWLRSIIWGVPAALIFLGTIALPEPREHLASRFARYLGDASYSIYLVHPIVFYVLARAITHYLPGTPGWVTLLIAIPLGTAAGLLFYRWVEDSITRDLRPRYERVSRRVLGRFRTPVTSSATGYDRSSAGRLGARPEESRS